MRSLLRSLRQLLLICLALLCWVGTGHADPRPIPLAGVFENYFAAGHSSDGNQGSHPTRYLTLHGELAPGIRYVAGELNVFGHDLLDENYVAVDRGAQGWRVGRFRSAFGLSDWSENYYAGFVHLPMLRTVALSPSLSLSRLDTGADWQGGTGALQYQLGLVDIQSRPYQPLPQRPDHFVGRVQTYRGNLILGFNLLVAGSGGEQTRLAALDGQWSVPHMQIRGEYLIGQAGDRHPQGGHLDFFYHPPVLTRTTFLARAEALSAEYTAGGAYGPGGAGEAEKQFARRYTVGVKQILSPQFTLELNRSWGNDTELTDQGPGWDMQLVTFTHF